MFDAVCAVTQSPSEFPGLPRDRNAPARAIQLPDESFASYFLDVFGRPQRLSACECERVNEASLAMTLHLLNSQEVQSKIANGNGRAAVLARETERPHDQRVCELYRWVYSREPLQEELDIALAHIAKHEANKQTQIAYEDIVWALINTKEFLFNH